MDPQIEVRGLAAAQDGLFTLSQATDVGLRADAVRKAVQRGRFERVGSRVFRVAGVPGSWRQELRCALLSIGAPVHLARSTALAMVGLAGMSQAGVPHVVVPYGRSVRADVPGHVHRSRRLEPEDTTVIKGLPSCTPTRAVVDLWSSTEPNAWRALASELVRSRLATGADLLASIDRAGRVAGRRAMQSIALTFTPEISRLRSGAEVVMRNLIEGSDLPRPSYNHRVLDGGRLVAEIDVAYPGLKLGFEIDGFAYHSSVTAVEHDATRDAALRRRGWTVPRIPASLLERSPASVLRMMRDELSAAASRS